MSILRNTQAALIAAVLAAGALTPLTPAHAAVSVQFDSGRVAFGYSDGYWDRSHQWHHWPSAAARNDWRAHNRGHYYARSHNRGRGGGWRDNDRWWER